MTPAQTLEDVASFLESVEWTGQNIERDAHDYAEQLRQVAVSLDAVPVVRLHELLAIWRIRQEQIHSDYWRDQGMVQVLEAAIMEIEAAIRDSRPLGNLAGFGSTSRPANG